MPKYRVRKTQPVWVDFYYDIEADAPLFATDAVEGGYGDYIGFDLGDNFECTEETNQICSLEYEPKYVSNPLPQPNWAVVEMTDGEIQSLNLFHDKDEMHDFIAECIRIATKAKAVFVEEIKEHFDQFDHWAEDDYSIHIHGV